MASKFALDVVQRHCETTQTVGSMRLADNVDLELQEVREVLDGLLGEVETEGDDQSELCQRARDLLSKLEVKP
jgi:hypothetical protein